MTFELDEETVQIIRTEVESGRFTTAEAFLQAATKAFVTQTASPTNARDVTPDEVVERFKKYRGKLDMTRADIIEARHQGLP